MSESEGNFWKFSPPPQKNNMRAEKNKNYFSNWFLRQLQLADVKIKTELKIFNFTISRKEAKKKKKDFSFLYAFREEIRHGKVRMWQKSYIQPLLLH